MQKIFYKLIKSSSNVKIGKMACTYSSIKNCPDTCKLKDNGCYAQTSYVGMIWKKLSEGNDKNSSEWSEHLNQIASLPEKSPIRVNVAGDLPLNKYGRINRNKVKSLFKALKNKIPIIYTHHKNLEDLKWMNNGEFTVIKSADNMNDLSEDIPNSIVIDQIFAKLKDETDDQYKERVGKDLQNLKTRFLEEKNIKLFVCPATNKDNINCLNCMVCSKMLPGFAVGFPAHGARKNKIEVA